jgi:hypothetical protein
MFAGAGGRGIAGDNEFVLLLHLELEPLWRSAFGVGRRFVLREDALESLALGNVVCLQPVLRQARGWKKRLLFPGGFSQDFLECCPARLKRLRAEIAAIDIEAVKYRVARFVGQVLQKLETGDAVAVERHHLAIQQQRFVWKSADRVCNGLEVRGAVLRIA